MKYRRLTIDELKELEQEFVRFLAANTVTSEDWQKIKTVTPQKAENLIEIFSDIVFEKTISRISHLEHRSPQDLKLFECLDDKIKLIGIKVVGVEQVDFTKNQSPTEMLQIFRTAPQGSIKMYSAEKNYQNNDRSKELFSMMQNGCLISKGELYTTVSEMAKQNK
jgi:hypothetical protein